MSFNNNQVANNKMNRDSKSNNNISRTMTSILRHNAKNYGLHMSDNGYVLVKDLLNLDYMKKNQVTMEMIEQIVENCPKQRFNLNKEDKNQIKIKANQGHTIKGLDDEKMMTEITLETVDQYPICVHGTYHTAYKLIQSSGGLSKMQRNHIHFSSKEFGSESMISGMRKNCQVLISIDLNQAIQDGYKFYVSDNEVILTPGNEHGMLPIKYFKNIKTLN